LCEHKPWYAANPFGIAVSYETFRHEQARRRRFVT
jgi:hypothetical protein